MPSRTRGASTRRLATIAAACAALAAWPGAAGAGGDAAAGKEKSVTCQACHGPDGNSPSPQFPRLAGQHADYLVKALADYQSGARKNPIMMGLSAGLSAQDREDLAAFFAKQKGDLHSIRNTR